MTSWDFLKELNKTCSFMSRERQGKATNSELKRWLKNKAVSINNEKVIFDEEVIFPIKEMSLFTKKNKVTLI